MNDKSQSSDWPALPFAEWKDTCATLQLWTQIIGKIRLTLSPWQNHSWHVTLYLSARGLTTSPIPYGARVFELRFDFIDHELRFLRNDGALRVLKLRPQSVAAFYGEVMETMQMLDLPIVISHSPNELADATPFERDEQHCSYDPEYAHRFWTALLQADRVFKKFRARFIGKCSPSHFFWGSFDLAVTRFSGRRAPQHPGGVPHLPDTVTREAYSHEVSSAGFWPGAEMAPQPIFYSYAYPEPPGFAEAKIKPAEASYNSTLHEFVLPYDAVRTASDPDAVLLDFLEDTYLAAAEAGKWDRAALEQNIAVLQSLPTHR